MKRLLTIVVLLMLLVTVIGCSKAPAVETTTAQTETKTEVKQPAETVEATKSEPTKEEPAPTPAPASDGIGFENKTLTITDIVVKVTDTTRYEANHFNYIDKPTIVIKYEFTNKKDEPLQPMIGWFATVNATQETDVTIEDLEVAMTPMDDPDLGPLFEMGMTDIKPGATVSAAMIYEIKYPDQPITLTFTRGIAGEKLGELIIE